MVNAGLGWNAAGVLPPYLSKLDGKKDRSPYLVSMQYLVDHFCTSEKRKQIFRGLLTYRELLHQHGIVRGFLWIGGSFTENIEMLESRDPNDVDVVTFCQIPPVCSQESLFKDFDHKKNMQDYLVDGYLFSGLGQRLERHHVRQIALWHNQWSHRRNGTHKGFFEVALSLEEDGVAKNTLDMKVVS